MANLENLKRLRAHIAAQPEDRVDLDDYFTVDPDVLEEGETERKHALKHLAYTPDCGTAGCIAGYAAAFAEQEYNGVSGNPEGSLSNYSILRAACDWVGVARGGVVAGWLFDGLNEAEKSQGHKGTALARLDRLIRSIENND